MPVETGKRFECSESGVQFMITKGGGGELSCVVASGAEAAQLGKRYQDEPTGIMVLCTKAGPSRIRCDGRDLVMLAPKTLPSSD